MSALSTGAHSSADRLLADYFATNRIYNVAQPIVSLDGIVVGLELLLRIEGITLEPPQAASFFSGLIEPSSYYAILQLALDTAQRIIAMDIHNLTIAINISQQDLLNPAVYRLLAERAETLLRSDCVIVFEICERVAFATDAGLEQAIKAIAKLGYQFALDDFLSPDSTTFPVRHIDLRAIKLDKSICKSYRRQPKDWALIKTIVYYCQLMGLSIIAEGVEERDQFIELRAMGIQEFQGYLFSPPIELEQLYPRLQALGYGADKPVSSIAPLWRE